MKKIKVACVISGGKDGIFGYYQSVKKYNVAVLLNLNDNNKDVSFHHYQKELVALQAKAIGLPLIQKTVVAQYRNQNLFEEQIFDIFSKLKKDGIRGVILGYVLTGDYQHDLLKRICSELEIKLILPNYKRNSKIVLTEIIESNIVAIITSVMKGKIAREWLGKPIDKKFLKYLMNKKNIDFCGDKGEFHTFVVDAPFFKKKIYFNEIEKNKIPLKDDFYEYCLKIKKYSFQDR